MQELEVLRKYSIAMESIPTTLLRKVKVKEKINKSAKGVRKQGYERKQCTLFFPVYVIVSQMLQYGGQTG